MLLRRALFALGTRGLCGLGALVAPPRPDALHADAWDIMTESFGAADPRAAIRRALRVTTAGGTDGGATLSLGDRSYDLSRYERVLVLGGGKAAAQMAEAAEEALAGCGLPVGGAVITKYGHGAGAALSGRVALREAGHPVPDEAGAAGAAELLALADGADERTLVLALISGGGSALLTCPAAGLALPEVVAMNEALLACGASIDQINTLRKHTSALSGGQLGARLAPATVLTLVLSDVVGDPLDVIASGPTVPDGAASTFGECERLVRELGIGDALPPAVLARFAEGAAGRLADTPKQLPGGGGGSGGGGGGGGGGERQVEVIGSNRQAVERAARRAEALGYHTLVLSTSVQGEAREVAAVYGAVAQELRDDRSERPLPLPACVIAGGETTVTLSEGHGKGGRNQELALAAARVIAGLPGALVLSAGTDGNDGPTDAAGAVADGGTLARAAAKGLDAGAYLAAHDAYTFFEALGDGLLVTGPTGTNVMDVALVMVAAPPDGDDSGGKISGGGGGGGGGKHSDD